MPLNSPQKVQYYRIFPALMKGDEAYMGLDALGNGILFGILNHQCLNGSVPADPLILSGIVRATPEEVQRFLATFTKLKTLADLEGGPADRLVSPFLDRELKAIHALIEARRQAGSKGGQRTQAKARPAQARAQSASSNAQAELEATLEPSSSRQEQEQETDKDQIQRNSSRHQRVHSNPVGRFESIADDADGAGGIPGDILEGLSHLGIASNLASELSAKVGGPRALRAALETLESKLQEKGIHSPSGFFLRCAPDLAREGLALYEQVFAETLASERGALRDPRWTQLPEACRESLEVLQTWRVWRRLQQGETNGDGFTEEASEARKTFLDACLRHHPERPNLFAALEEKIQQMGNVVDLPGVAIRARYKVLESLLGVAEPPSSEGKPTPLNGVAS